MQVLEWTRSSVIANTVLVCLSKKMLSCLCGCNTRFATALVHQKVDWWVMNVVPISGPNTLPVIYDRGLIGVSHDWYTPALLCYPHSTVLITSHWFTGIINIVCFVSNISRLDGYVFMFLVMPHIIIKIPQSSPYKCRCEPFDTYPRTYDLLHAVGLFTVEDKRCSH